MSFLESKLWKTKLFGNDLSHPPRVVPGNKKKDVSGTGPKFFLYMLIRRSNEPQKKKKWISNFQKSLIVRSFLIKLCQELKAK